MAIQVVVDTPEQEPLVAGGTIIGTMIGMGSSGGGSSNDLVITCPASLYNTMASDGIFCSPQSTGEELDLYNNIVEVVTSDKLYSSIVRFVLEEGESNFGCNIPLSVMKFQNYMNFSAYLGLTDYGESKLIIQSYNEDGQDGYLIDYEP